MFKKVGEIRFLLERIKTVPVGLVENTAKTPAIAR